MSALASLNAELDPHLDERVRLHRARAAGDVTVPTYLSGLRAVREAEDRIEPQRRALGASCSRALELVRLEAGVGRQLDLFASCP